MMLTLLRPVHALTDHLQRSVTLRLQWLLYGTLRLQLLGAQQQGLKASSKGERWVVR
jgi:hypothetical protein